MIETQNRGMAGADRRGHRLLDEENPAGTGALGRLLDRSELDRGGPGGHADDDLRAREGAPVVHLADEVLEHLPGDFEVGDDALAQRAHGPDVARRTTHHPPSLAHAGDHTTPDLHYRQCNP